MLVVIGCELLSDCIFDLLSTTSFCILITIILLWIAFRLYLWPTEHNCSMKKGLQSIVVNCFQIVSLTYWAQRIRRMRRVVLCCELLSDCIFDLLSTTHCPVCTQCLWLWIAFRLYLWPTEHNTSRPLKAWAKVVNCFQIVSLTYWAQHITHTFMHPNSCELLSDCIFDLLSTTLQYQQKRTD